MNRILLLEDDEALGRGICMALKTPDCTVTHCGTRLQATDILQNMVFDLLILDINLPDGSGLDLLRALRQNGDLTPAILLTANDLELDEVTGLEAGADDYITKPFSLAVLRARVNARLRRSVPANQDRVELSGFIVANAGKFQTSTLFSAEQALPRSAIEAINARGGVTESGVVYGMTAPALEYVTKDWFRQNRQSFYTPEEMENLIRLTDKNEAGDLASSVQLSGMSAFALNHLTVLEGNLSALYEPDSRNIAAVYAEDEYGNADRNSHWARLGDTVTVRYVEKFEYCDPDTGDVWADPEDIPDGVNWVERPVKYRDVDYTVAALVAVPSALSYRYYGSDEFILNDQTFVQDTGTDSIMYYAFDTTDESNADMETFLTDYTENVNPELDYESKSTYAGEFESMRTMFLLLGGALSFIVGLVGVLNFFNAILTGIIARQRELAVLQAVGMTGKQLRAMLGAGIPALTIRAAQRRTVVERLRME